MSIKVTTSNTNKGGPVENAPVRHIIYEQMSGSYTYARPIYYAMNKYGSVIYTFYCYPRIWFTNYYVDDLLDKLTINIYRTSSPYEKAPVSETTPLQYVVDSNYDQCIKLLDPCYYGDTYKMTVYIPKNLGIYIPDAGTSNYDDLIFDSWDPNTRTLTTTFTIKQFYTTWNPDEDDDMYYNQFSLPSYQLDYEYEMSTICQTGKTAYSNTFNINGYSSYMYPFNIGDTITVEIAAGEGFTWPTTPQYLFGDSTNPNYLLKEGTNTYVFEGVSYLNPIFYNDTRGSNKLKAQVMFNVNTYPFTIDPKMLENPDACTITAEINSSGSYGDNYYGTIIQNGSTLYYSDYLYIEIYCDNYVDYFKWDYITITHGNVTETFSDPNSTIYFYPNLSDGSIGVCGDIYITGARKPKSTTIQEITEETTFGAKICVNRVSSPYQGASTGKLSQGSTIYAGDVLEIYYTIPASIQPLVDSDQVRYSTSFWHDYDWYDLTTTPTRYTVGDELWEMKLSLTGYNDSYGLYISDGAAAGTANARIIVNRNSSPTGLGNIEELSDSSTIYPGDTLEVRVETYNNYYCYSFTYGNSFGEYIDLTSSPVAFTVSGSLYFTQWSNPMTTLSSLGYTVSGTSITNYSGSASSLTIMSKYYTIKLFNGSTIQVTDWGTSITSDAIVGETLIDTIGANAFKGKSSLTSVTIPSSVKWIGDYAFAQCPNLATVTMSATPTSIGQYAFWLTKITSLSSYMYNCTSLGSGCFASYDGWYLAAPSGSTSLGGDAVINRLKATSANTDYGRVYEVRARFNVHKGGGDNGLSGGSFSCTCKVTVTGKNQTRTWTTLSASCAYGANKAGVTYAVCGPSVSLSESFSMSSSPSNYSTWRSGCANKTLNAGGTCDHDCYAQVDSTCLTDHTLLTLADGSRKRADQITYNDLLLTYNFETGKQDYQYPLAITRGEIHDHFTRIHLENNLYIDICGHHDIYDPKAQLFRTYGDGNILSNGIKDYYILDDSGQTVKIKSIERVEKEVTAYCIITSGTITAYADTVMIGMSHMNFGRIDSTNKFSKAFETDKLLCYDYNTFRKEVYDEPEQDLIIGTCLHFAHYYNKDGSGLGRLLAPLKRRIPLPQYKNKNLYTLGFIDRELTEMQSVEDEIIVLPEIKSPGKTKWYIVGEYKYLNPGDTYITKFSTVIRAV